MSGWTRMLFTASGAIAGITSAISGSSSASSM
jgi:hypothetical protein